MIDLYMLELLHLRQDSIAIGIAFLGLVRPIIVLLRGRRGRGSNVKLEAWNFWLQGVLCTSSAVIAHKVEVVLISRRLRNAMACAVLPNIAFLTCDAMGTVILVTQSA